MSSLLLSQSIISSTENSIREKSIQRGHHQAHPHQLNLSHNLQQQLYYQQRQQLMQQDANRKAQDVPKFCWLVFISTLVLIFYLFIFALIAIICYLLIIWIPNDLERNKMNNELYESIVGNRSNILLIGQLPQLEQKFLMTKNLWLFESKIQDDLMNFRTKPISLQNKYPALFWNEDFRSMAGDERTRGAVWLDRLGQLIFVFMMPIDETTVKMIRFQPSNNHIQIVLRTIDLKGSWILPISSEDPETELELILTGNDTLKVFINQLDQERILCIDTKESKIDLLDGKSHQNFSGCSTKQNFDEFGTFTIGYVNGSSLHLVASSQKVLITPENVLYRSGKSYDYELIPIDHWIHTHLMPVILDYVFMAVAIFVLVIVIVCLIKYLIMSKRNLDDSSDDNDESHPLIYTDRHGREFDPSDNQNGQKIPFLSKLFCCSCCQPWTTRRPGYQPLQDSRQPKNIKTSHSPGTNTPGDRTPTIIKSPTSKLAIPESKLQKSPPKTSSSPSSSPRKSSSKQHYLDI